MHDPLCLHGHNRRRAVSAAGETSCWGDIGFVLLNEDYPNPGLGAHPLPVPIPYLPSVAIELGSQGRTSCIRDADGIVRCWGYGNGGATGNGHIGGFDTSADPVLMAL